MKYRVERFQDELEGYWEDGPLVLWEGNSFEGGLKALRQHQYMTINDNPTARMMREADEAELLPYGPKDPFRAADASNPCRLGWKAGDGSPVQLIDRFVQWNTVDEAFGS